MRAVLIEAPAALLEERRRLGLDVFDEMWAGVLHMVPPPGGPHQRLEGRLLYAAADDHRIPGLAVYRGTCQ